MSTVETCGVARAALAARRVAIVIALTFRALPSRLHGYIGTLAIAVAFAAAIGAFLNAAGPPAEEREVVVEVWNLANTAGVDAQLSLLLDPLSIFMALVVSGVSMLIHLYSVSYMGGDRGYTRFFAYLNFFVFSMLLLVLAANFFLLIVGWAFVGAASYLLISFWYRRRRRPRQASRRSSSTWSATSASCSGPTSSSSTPGRSTSCGAFARAGRVQPQRGRPRRGLPADPGRRVRQVGAGAAAHLAPGRDGGPDPRLRPDPRRDDGHRRRLPDRAHVAAVRAGSGRRRRRRDRRLPDAADRRHDRPRRDRPEARHRLLDDVADRLHDHGDVARPPTSPACST